MMRGSCPAHTTPSHQPWPGLACVHNTITSEADSQGSLAIGHLVPVRKKNEKGYQIPLPPSHSRHPHFTRSSRNVLPRTCSNVPPQQVVLLNCTVSTSVITHLNSTRYNTPTRSYHRRCMTMLSGSSTNARTISAALAMVAPSITL